MAECHAAIIGAACGFVGPHLSHCIGGFCGATPDHTGTGREVPLQPVGVISVFGAMVCSAAAAFGSLAIGSVAGGAAVGAVAAVFITSVSAGDMLKRRDLLAFEPGIRRTAQELCRNTTLQV
ncbi:unnamed protein product [Polarella glacialis]|uniref:Uncharacterized protein n=1 Tax=Polarella glacialis TaxID=89957 RepID=A0A813LPK0_POLGL|nr:unnamed protein product [Polarella glacialis]